MNLYLISQIVARGYNTYDSAVVAAESVSEAKTIHPGSLKHGSTKLLSEHPTDDYEDDGFFYEWQSWAVKVEDISAAMIGKAAKGVNKGVICASFHAG